MTDPDIPVRALSVRPPWSACIAATTSATPGIDPKRIENRTWTVAYRGLVLIHASRSVDETALRHPLVVRLLPRGRRMVLGAVVAVADLVDVHPDDGRCTPWAQPGFYHWRLDRVRPVPRPVPCRGRLGLWQPSRSILAAIGAQDPERFPDLPVQSRGGHTDLFA